MDRIGIVVKADDAAQRKADELESWLVKRGIEVIQTKNFPHGRKGLHHNKTFAPSDLFCIFVLGGDGTFLSAVRWIGNQKIPVIGVKFGETGFLAETAENDLFTVTELILNRKFSIEPRMRLLVKVIRGETERASETVLNDVVVNKGALARLAYIKTYLDDYNLTTYRADGLIVATPTGSTAYSLAAGGPIIHPAVPGIVMTPICPFTLTNRPLIVPDSVTITIRLAKKSSNIMLTFDGQVGLEINDRDRIVVQKDRHPVNMITISGHHYYDVLKTRLSWGDGRN